MHTLNRILTALVLLIVLVPPATFALVSLDEKEHAQQELQQAIGTAVYKYQQRSGLQSVKGKNERTVAEQGSKIATLASRRRELRFAIVKQRRIVKAIGDKYGIVIDSKDRVTSMINVEKRRVARLMKDRYLRKIGMDFTDARDVVLYTMFHAAADQGSDMVTVAQTDFLHDLVAAQRWLAQLEESQAAYDSLLGEQRVAEQKYDAAAEAIERSTEQLEEIKRITEEVHNQVLKMQSELARIDARLKAKAERVLIEKGLLDPKSIGQTDGIAFKPQFSWPVYGRRTAGFKNADYVKHFGVPHYGQDLAIDQGSPVYSAAEGVVFLVRDGGKTGYSYILIGHRGGYATLYGHVSEALVTAGQEVAVGQAIALSGGKPGTHGAGPMTTGPHLHFEVIHAGVNIDPMTVLP